MTNWNKLTEPTVLPAIKKFSAGDLSGRKMQKSFAFTDYAGEIRSLIREHGVTKARKLARKALSRRKLS